MTTATLPINPVLGPVCNMKMGNIVIPFPADPLPSLWPRAEQRTRYRENALRLKQISRRQTRFVQR